jgi:PAS domain S-box-containing protein
LRPEKSQESERELTGPRIDFRGIVYSIPFGVVLCRDPDYRIVFSNRAFYSTLGFFSAEDVDGTLLTQLVHPEDRVMVDDRLRLILESGATVSACRARLLGQAGRVALVDISVMSVVDYDGVRAVVVGAKDVTEEQRLTRRNLQADKMDTVGRLAGGIAHDFNNLLTAIIGFAHLSTLTEGVDERTVELIGEIQTAAERAAILTGQLLAFSRKEMLIPQVLNLDDLIRDSESSIRDYAGDDIDLSLELSATGSVDLDPTHMIQALLVSCL